MQMSTLSPELADSFLLRMAERFKVLGEPMRLRILHSLMGEEQTVNALARHCASTAANVSRHLQILRLHQVVTGRKEGQEVYYRIIDPAIPELCAFVCERLAGEELNKQV